MSLGFDAIAALPFATSGPDNSVNVSVSANQLTITIGSVGIIADAITQDADPNALTLGLGTLSTLGVGTVTVTADATASPTANALTLATGSVTITGEALVSPSGVPLTVNTKEPGIITWNEIIPGANMVWTPIDPS